MPNDCILCRLRDYLSGDEDEHSGHLHQTSPDAPESTQAPAPVVAEPAGASVAPGAADAAAEASPQPTQPQEAGK